MVVGGAKLAFLSAILAVSYAALSIFFHHLSEENIQSIEAKLPGYSTPWYTLDPEGYQPAIIFLPLLGGGLILPLFEAYTKQSRIERVLQQLHTHVQATLSESEKTFPAALQFVKEKAGTIKEELEARIDLCLRDTAMVDSHYKNRGYTGNIAELHYLQQGYQKALAELDKFITFYQKFN